VFHDSFNFTRRLWFSVFIVNWVYTTTQILATQKIRFVGKSNGIFPVANQIICILLPTLKTYNYRYYQPINFPIVRAYEFLIDRIYIEMGWVLTTVNAAQICSTCLMKHQGVLVIDLMIGTLFNFYLLFVCFHFLILCL
jgi:hypothetical protein